MRLDITRVERAVGTYGPPSGSIRPVGNDSSRDRSPPKQQQRKKSEEEELSEEEKAREHHALDLTV